MTVAMSNTTPTRKFRFKAVEPGLEAVFEALAARYDNAEPIGTKTELSEALGITKQACSQWKHVPIEHVLTIEALLEIPRHVLRPDIYPDPTKDTAYGRPDSPGPRATAPHHRKAPK